ncbi:MAG TPA: ABC transporter ATP-binding protein [Epulopiscium sp.]|nr:ABC transporter ATP-binding protein [Candidatus Epulonipiscium sp.]
MSEQKQKGAPRGPGGGMGHGAAGMSMPPEKAKDFKGTLRRLGTYLKPQTLKLVIVVLAAILSTVFSVVTPVVMGEAITSLYQDVMTSIQGKLALSINFDIIGKVLWKLGALYVLSALFSYVQQVLMASVTQDTVYDLRKDINGKLSRLPLKYFDSRTHGEILSRVTNDIDNISSTLQQSITQLITSILTLIGVIAMMLRISWVMTLILVITLPLSVLITKNVAKKSQLFFRDQQKSVGNLNGHVEEMYTGHKVIKAFGYEERSIKKFNKINEALYDSGWKAQFVSGLIMPLMNFVSNIGYVFVCIVGGIFVTRGLITIGNIQAFIQYARQFTQPIVQVANIANVIQSTIASAERVFEVVDEEEEVENIGTPIVIENPQGNVTFDHVEFGYKQDEVLMKDMSIDVKKGQTIAIVGPTGAGKTTLVNLLMRFYEISKGSITVDGINITDLKREDLRSMFGMVLQDTWLFNGTIKENIMYGNINASETEMISAAKAARVDKFIRTLPEGYDTILNEEASNISQGQKQLITIARAILANPVVLILDEATSSVDTRTEIYIQRAMEELMKNRTSFVIAHRLSTIKDANLILVMNDGDIIETGTHDELIAQAGFYEDLYNSQFTGTKRQGKAI